MAESVLNRYFHFGSWKEVSLPYTAEADGFMNIDCASNGSGVIYFSVGGISNLIRNNSTNMNGGGDSKAFPIKKGDTVSVSYNSGMTFIQARFMPILRGGYRLVTGLGSLLKLKRRWA